MTHSDGDGVLRVALLGPAVQNITEKSSERVEMVAFARLLRLQRRVGRVLIVNPERWQGRAELCMAKCGEGPRSEEERSRAEV